MSKLLRVLAFSFLSVSVFGCEKIADILENGKHASNDSDESESEAPKKKKKKKKTKKKSTEKETADNTKKKKSKKDQAVLADIGFRPESNGFNFRNTGGDYPMTEPVLNENVMVKLFGPEACVGRDTESCTLTLPAFEWANMINRAMNGGQCEGMAVSSLTYFNKTDKPRSPLDLGAHDLKREEATPLIAYYWSYQALDPVLSATISARRKSTPVEVEDELVEMFKKKQLATIAFWNPRGRGGHAVTPYAVEDKGNGIHWIKIYDNNYPNKERYIIIDRNANTWRYDLAALNPAEPKMPWDGGADSHNIVIIPLDLRLQKAVCPFCEQSEKKVVWPRSANVSIADPEGHRVAVEGDKIVNEIPGAEVVDLSSWTADAEAVDPIFFLPASNDYDVTIAKGPKSAASPDDEAGVAVFGPGTAVTVAGVDLGKDDKDTLSVPRDTSGIRYRSSTGKMPALKLAFDDKKEGVSVRIANMKADKDSEVELSVDKKLGKATVQGGGKSTSSYDLEMRHTVAGTKGVDKVVQTGIKFKLGDAHDIDTKPLPKAIGSKIAPLPKISHGVFKVRPTIRPDAGGTSPKGIDPKGIDPKGADKTDAGKTDGNKKIQLSLPKPKPSGTAAQPTAPKLIPKKGVPQKP
ncbi:MAG TPA: hypothetical protein VL400_02260 [Polyangiaceae bacterium]|nr:hypothetical protein [Polyangiaceae bacterium]